MRDQVQARPGRACARERQRVFDRAGAERRVLEAVDPVLVVIEQRLARAAGCCIHSLPNVPLVSQNVPCTSTSSGLPSGAPNRDSGDAVPLSLGSDSDESW